MVIITTIVIIITIFLTQNIFLIIFSYFISNTIIRLILFKFTIRNNQFNEGVDSESMTYGKKLTGISIIDTVMSQIDKILIFHYLGAVDLAIYMIAIAPPNQLRSLFGSLQSLSLPKFSQKTIKEIKETIFIKIIKYLAILSIIITLYILFAPYFFKILFPQYLTSIQYTQIYSLSLLSLPVLILLSIFHSQKMVSNIISLKIINQVFELIILFIFIINMGLLGVIISRVVSKLFNLLTYSIAIKYKT